jgi:hypothetical protein
MGQRLQREAAGFRQRVEAFRHRHQKVAQRL